uniref:Uncharacterized protein n=1 Tax=Picea sitchensis TaxID=3332 RepID=A9P125_PICSI|nr:unknown [Picea sitchensis]
MRCFNVIRIYIYIEWLRHFITRKSVLEFLQNVLTLEQQLDNFKLYREKLVNMLGPENSSEVISGALFVISMGTNDFSNNYYLNPSTRAHYTIDEFQDHVLHTLSRFIEVSILPNQYN